MSNKDRRDKAAVAILAAMIVKNDFHERASTATICDDAIEVADLLLKKLDKTGEKE
jgi:hypothetical protein